MSDLGLAVLLSAPRGQHGETPDPEALTAEERMVLEHWQLAESAALEAVFGAHRHLDEGGYEIGLQA